MKKKRGTQTQKMDFPMPVWPLNSRGFSLIEMLIVIGMLGGIMAAMFTLYQVQQRSSVTQEEVVEVQQNLRIAMESITKDVEMAGFLAPSTSNPIETAAAINLTMNTASAAGVYARISGPLETAGAQTLFPIESSAAAALFTAGDFVRIIRPQLRTEPSVGIFTVAATPAPGVSSLMLNIPAGIAYVAGDVIVRTRDVSGNPNPAHPNTVSYSLVAGAAGTACPLGQNCIARTATDSGQQIVASNISANGLQFTYLLKTDPSLLSCDGTETATPMAAQLVCIRAVRVTITGQTVTTAALSGNTPKVRVLSSIAKIRNRIGG